MEKLMNYALRIFSKKRYTVCEMQKKLHAFAKKRDIEDENVDLVIERMHELDYLDDKKFVEDYVNECVRLKPRGKILIRRELKFKGVPSEVVDAYIDVAEIDEGGMAHDLLTRKVARWRKFPEFKQKSKAYQFLYSKGFARDAIYSAMDKCYSPAR